MTEYTFGTNLPWQSSDPKHETLTIVDVITKEDAIVGKINGVDSAELLEPKKDAERKKTRCKKSHTLTRHSINEIVYMY